MTQLKPFTPIRRWERGPLYLVYRLRYWWWLRDWPDGGSET